MYYFRALRNISFYRRWLTTRRLSDGFYFRLYLIISIFIYFLLKWLWRPRYHATVASDAVNVNDSNNRSCNRTQCLTSFTHYVHTYIEFVLCINVYDENSSRLGVILKRWKIVPKNMYCNFFASIYLYKMLGIWIFLMLSLGFFPQCQFLNIIWIICMVVYIFS